MTLPVAYALRAHCVRSRFISVLSEANEGHLACFAINHRDQED